MKHMSIDKLIEKHTIALTKRTAKSYAGDSTEVVSFDEIVINMFEFRKELLTTILALKELQGEHDDSCELFRDVRDKECSCGVVKIRKAVAAIERLFR
jgi:hypothetical protein